MPTDSVLAVPLPRRLAAPLLATAMLTCALGSAAFFLLQPLSIAAQSARQSPASALVWFQAAYLAGFAWALATARLHPRHDAVLQLGALVAVLMAAAAAAESQASWPPMPHWPMLALAAWLAASGTVVLRMVSRMALAERAWWVLAAANLGAMAGLLGWLLPGDAVASTAAWRWLGAALIGMGFSFVALVSMSWRVSDRVVESGRIVRGPPGVRAIVAWLAGPAAASAALVWGTQAASERLSEVAADRLAAAHLAAFLWAHVVVWSLRGCAAAAATRALGAAVAALAFAAIAAALLGGAVAASTSVLVHLFCLGCMAWVAWNAPAAPVRTLFMGSQAAGGFAGGALAAWIAG